MSLERPQRLLTLQPTSVPDLRHLPQTLRQVPVHTSPCESKGYGSLSVPPGGRRTRFEKTERCGPPSNRCTHPKTGPSARVTNVGRPFLRLISLATIPGLRFPRAAVVPTRQGTQGTSTMQMELIAIADPATDQVLLDLIWHFAMLSFCTYIYGVIL